MASENETKGTLTRTISFPSERLKAWNKLKNKSSLVQLLLQLSDTFETQAELEDFLRKAMFARRNA